MFEKIKGIFGGGKPSEDKGEVLLKEWREFLSKKLTGEAGPKKVEMRARVFEEWVIKKLSLLK